MCNSLHMYDMCDIRSPLLPLDQFLRSESLEKICSQDLHEFSINRMHSSVFRATRKAWV